MDDDLVSQYIDEAMNQFPYTYGAAKLDRAWSWLYGHRGEVDPNDENDEMAAAEHYLWARKVVVKKEFSPFITRLLVLGYDPVKLLGYLPPIFAARKLAGHTWSWPSTGSIAWGNQGVHDGVRDNALADLQPQ